MVAHPVHWNRLEEGRGRGLRARCADDIRVSAILCTATISIGNLFLVGVESLVCGPLDSSFTAVKLEDISPGCDRFSNAISCLSRQLRRAAVPGS